MRKDEGVEEERGRGERGVGEGGRGGVGEGKGERGGGRERENKCEFFKNQERTDEKDQNLPKGKTQQTRVRPSSPAGFRLQPPPRPAPPPTWSPGPGAGGRRGGPAPRAEPAAAGRAGRAPPQGRASALPLTAAHTAGEAAPVPRSRLPCLQRARTALRRSGHFPLKSTHPRAAAGPRGALTPVGNRRGRGPGRKERGVGSRACGASPHPAPPGPTSFRAASLPAAPGPARPRGRPGGDGADPAGPCSPRGALTRAPAAAPSVCGRIALEPALLVGSFRPNTGSGATTV